MSIEIERPHFSKGEQISNQLGETFGIIGKIGEGRCSVVYEALDVKNSKCVALKIYNSGRRYDGALQRELSVLEMLKSSNKQTNTVEWYGHFETLRHHCLVLELLDCNIRQILFKNNKQGLGLWGIQKFARDIFTGVEALHSRRLVHADLKPANIHWCAQHGCYKLLDFGLSFHLSEEDIHQVQSVGYQAPEVTVWNRYKQGRSSAHNRNSLYQNKNHLQSRTFDFCRADSFCCRNRDTHGSRTKPLSPGKAIDVWSVGCLLMEVATGRKFLKDGESICSNKIKHYGCKLHDLVDAQLAEVMEAHKRNGLEIVTYFEVLKDFIHRCLDCSHLTRITSEAALQHPFLQLTFEPSPSDCLLLPTCVLMLSEIIDPANLNNSDANNKILSKVLEVCEKSGPILSSYLALNGNLKGSVLILYERSRNSQLAIKRLQGETFNGRTLTTSFYPLELFKQPYQSEGQYSQYRVVESLKSGGGEIGFLG